MRPVLLAAALLIAAGCNTADPPADTAPVVAEPTQQAGLVFTSGAATYRRGATARLTFTNGTASWASSGPLGCSRLERWTGAAWQMAPEWRRRGCIAEVVTVTAGETITADIPLDVPAGRYRLAWGVSMEGALHKGIPLSTAAFEVVE